MVGADVGFRVFAPDQDVLAWAQAANATVEASLSELLCTPGQLRSGGTWFVGVDALANAGDGSIAGTPLKGAWLTDIDPPQRWHRAQVSIAMPGYPRKDPEESDAAFRYRKNRCAAHVDGLHAVGPDRRRYLREPHHFIAGLPLTHSNAAPLTVWKGSHKIMGQALRDAVGQHNPENVDLTEAYVAARRQVFDLCEPLTVQAEPGQVVLMHRHLLHGIAPWGDAAADGAYRMIAYFRPLMRSGQDWIRAD